MIRGGLLLLLLVGLACDGGPDPAAPVAAPPQPAASGWPEVEVQIGMYRLRAEVADTPARRSQGLSGRRTLAADRGVVFPYSDPARPAFWMPDMHFDIDIVWIREGRIVDLHARVPHEVTPPLPRYQPREPIDRVLEVPAGTAERLGWRVGDPVSFSPEPIYRSASGS